MNITITITITNFHSLSHNHEVPPSKSPLVETSVSKLTTNGICDYFASKGNPVSGVVRQTPDFLDIFIKNVRVDYTCLETYPATYSKLNTPLVVIGGGLDPGVSSEDLEGWKRHVKSNNKGAEDAVFDEQHTSLASMSTRFTDVENEPGSEHPNVTVKVYPDQGHFYLNDEHTLADLGDFIVATMDSIGKNASKTKQDIEEEAEMKQHVTAAFQKALDIQVDVPPDAHFFNELGGTSLDTMVLTANLQAVVGLRITQDEFILHPTLNALTERILELQMLSTNAPTLDPIEPKGGEDWFPASAGQVRATLYVCNLPDSLPSLLILLHIYCLLIYRNKW